MKQKFMNKNYILISFLIFIILSFLNTIRINDELKNYNDSQYTTYETELKTIMVNVKNVSDSIYDNMINTPAVINIFKSAHEASEEEKYEIRKKLYASLKNSYDKFTRYGVQQLHFHLPNNESFLRFHRPEKYGDDLTQVRESVKYVNKNKKPISGFEEGKIFNGYRFVYPLFDENSIHLGSVEVSASLLSFKKIFERTGNLNLDFILTKQTVLNKVFQSQLTNYHPYLNFENFLIQTTMHEYNVKHGKYERTSNILNNLDINNELLSLEKQIYTKLIDKKLYTVFFIPLHNDFIDKEVGYMVLCGESTYLNYFLKSIVISYIGILILSILIGYIIFKNKKCLMETLEKEKFKIESYTDELTSLSNRKFYNIKINEKIDLAQRYNVVFSLIIYDIDHFKNINDTYGHETGDKVLVQMSELIRSSLRKNDYVFRIGGEEFIIILPHTRLKEAALTAEKIRLLVQNNLNTIEEETITISLGVTQVRKEDTASSIFNRVDGYLYESKHKGRNLVTSDLSFKS